MQEIRLSEFSAYNGDTHIHFELFMNQKNTEIAEQHVLEKKFNLITTLGTTNMRLYDMTGLNIRKYPTLEESEYVLDICCKKKNPTYNLLTEITPFSTVLEEFFSMRLEYYAKRKVYNTMYCGFFLFY